MQLEGTLFKPDVAGGDGSAGTVLSTSKLGQDEFLKLLIAKLQNQDPLNPQDDSEFLGQLAQFSALEQLVSINSNLVSLLDKQNQLLDGRALSLLGHEVIVQADTFTVEEGNAPAIGYELPARASELVVGIYNEGGQLVRKVLNVPKAAGTHEIDFDGKDAAGRPLRDGTYEIRIAALDANGGRLTVTPYIRGAVTGVSAGEDGGVRLLLGSQEVDLCDVRAVLVASEASEDPEPVGQNPVMVGYTMEPLAPVVEEEPAESLPATEPEQQV